METTMIEGATLPAKTHMPDDDLALVQAVRGGDVAAFEQLVKRYDAKLLRIAQNVTHNSEDAEEVVQEAFFKAYQKLDQFEGHAKFSTWLVRIALNESFMKMRKRRGILEQSSTAMLFPTATERDFRLTWPIGHRIPRRNTAQPSFARFSSALSNG